MGDPFRKVRPGEDLAIPATTFNAMVDAGKLARAARYADATRREGSRRDAAIVRVVNETGGDLRRTSVVGLDAPTFTPGQDLDAFLRDVTFRGVVPGVEHAGRFAVLIEPIAAGRAGLAVVAGVVPAIVDVEDAGHTCADATPGDTVALTSADSGPAQILWSASGVWFSYEDGYVDPTGQDPETGFDTGLSWAIVLIGSSCGGDPYYE